MKFPVLFKRVVVFVLVSSLFGVLACEGADPPVIVASGDSPPPPDVTDGNGDHRSEVYAAGHPYHERALSRWLREPELWSVIDSFESRGYELSPAGGFTVDAADGTSSATVTFVALDGTGPAGDRSVMVACYGDNGSPAVSAAEFSKDRPAGETDWRELGELGWIRTEDPDGPGRSAARYEGFSWEAFWDCVLEGAPGTMVGCTYTCAFIGPGYWHCMLFCVFTQTAFKAAMCVITTLAGGGTRVKEDPR